MIFSKLNVEPRQNPIRHTQIKKSIKSKTSLPETCSSAEVAFEQIKLTQSQDIQNLFTSEFQLNIIPPITNDDKGEKLAKRFASPEWLISSNMLSSIRAEMPTNASENPETFNDSENPSCNEYSNTCSESEKTESQNEIDLLKVDKSEIQRILEMTVSDDREREFNETNLKSQLQSDILESKSAVLYGIYSSGSDKANQTTHEMNKVDQSNLMNKPKSAILISEKLLKNLDEYYKKECEVFSEYGLKPCEENRLKKIQELEKIELLKDQEECINGDESELDQEYFNLSKAKKTARENHKFRKCSAALLTQENSKGETNFSKKSKSKHKHSLSKDKKLKSPETHILSKLPSMKKINANSGKK